MRMLGIEWQRPTLTRLAFSVLLAVATWALVDTFISALLGRESPDRWMWLAVIIWSFVISDMGVSVLKGGRHLVVVIVGSAIIAVLTKLGST